MNEQGTQVAPQLFKQLNPGGGQVITHYDFFMEAKWTENQEQWPTGENLHFLFDAEGGFHADSRNYRVNGGSYIIQIFNEINDLLVGSAEDTYGTKGLNNLTFKTNDYLWDKPDIKGYKLSFHLEPCRILAYIVDNKPFLIWARFTTILNAPIIHKIIDIGLSKSTDDTFSDSEGAIIRPDTLTFLTYEEFMEKLKAAWANPLI